MEHDTMRTQQVRRLHFFSFIVGVWILVAPFILNYGRMSVTVNEVIAGAIVAGLSATRLRALSATWASWGLLGVGTWQLLSPFIFSYSKTSTYWNELLFGIVLIVLMFSALGSTIRHHSHLVH